MPSPPMPAGPLKPETLLERKSKSFQETPGKALDTYRGKGRLIFTASSLAMNFNCVGGSLYPLDGQAEYEDLKSYWGEDYDFVLEGGQIASDFATGDEIDNVAAIVNPYLTGSQPYVGGVPICSGWKILKRKLSSWIVQRGSGYSIKPASDSGYAPLPSAYFYQRDTPQDPIEINGFVINGGGYTIPQWPPVNVAGAYMPALSTTPGPFGGGAVFSQRRPFLGAVSVHQVNLDGTLNAVMTVDVQLDYKVIPPALFRGAFNTQSGQYFSTETLGSSLAGQITGNFPSSYPPGDTDNWDQSSPPPRVPPVPPYGDQFGHLPFVIVVWIGIDQSQVPQVDYIPSDVNAARVPFMLSDYGTFLSVN